MVKKKRRLTRFGKAVKTRVIEKDITLAELAEEVGISQQQLTNILIGERPGKKHRSKIIQILELPDKWIEST